METREHIAHTEGQNRSWQALCSDEWVCARTSTSCCAHSASNSCLCCWPIPLTFLCPAFAYIYTSLRSQFNRLRVSFVQYLLPKFSPYLATLFLLLASICNSFKICICPLNKLILSQARMLKLMNHLKIFVSLFDYSLLLLAYLKEVSTCHFGCSICCSH